MTCFHAIKHDYLTTVTTAITTDSIDTNTGRPCPWHSEIFEVRVFSGV